MSTASGLKYVVISNNGTRVLEAVATHFRGSHGVHVGGEQHGAAIDKLAADQAAAHQTPGLTVREIQARVDALQDQIAAHADALKDQKWIGVVYYTSDDAFEVLGALPGVFVSDSRSPDPLPAQHLAAVAHVPTIGPGETGYTLARKLMDHYRASYFRPH